jgi:hypothetical protein
VEKESEAKEPELVKYLAEVRKMERHFWGFTIEHLPRKHNGEADELAKKAARGEAMPPDVFFEVLTATSTKPDKQPLSTINAIASLDWRAPIIAFLRGHYEPVETHDQECRQGPRVISLGTMSCSSLAYVHHCSSVFLKIKASSSREKSMEGCAARTLQQEHWLEKLSGKVSIGQWP